ncbi:MAG: hypothetical protein ACI4OH_05120 [Mitsuokella sp.]|uniref:hypothetical protein n=1 Tax=Mitsuokella sp. TaxID=2049034 RepID=UPI003F0CE68E
MKVNEVLNDRDLIARILTKNLRQYGNLEPSGFYTRPVHGTGDELRMMSRSNYLRVAAYLHEDSAKNPHFVSQEEAVSLHLVVKPSARPVYLEHWTRDNQGEYSADLVPYYNIDDTIGRHKRIETFRHVIPERDQPKHLQAAASFLGLDAAPENGEGIRDAAYQVAQEMGLSVLEAKAFSQLVLKDYNLTSDFSKHPLYSEDEILAFDANPRSLFTAVTQASKLERNLPVLLAQKEAQIEAPAPEAGEEQQVVQEDASKAPKEEPSKQPSAEKPEEKVPPKEPETAPKEATASEKEEPAKDTKAEEASKETKQPESEFFKTLKVHLEYCDKELVDFEGNPYPEPCDLTGEKAYEFLVQLNHLDKACFSHGRTDKVLAQGDGKVSFSLSYGENLPKLSPGDTHLFQNIGAKMGDLTFCNATSVAQMLDKKALWILHKILESDKQAKNILQLSHKPIDDEHIQDIREDVKPTLTAFQEKVLEPLQKEEDAYLAKHPEIKAIQDETVTPYIYVCRKEDYTKEGIDIHSNGLVPADEMKDYVILPVSQAEPVLTSLATSEEKARKVDERYTKARNGLPNSMVAFYSSHNPDLMTMKNENVLLVIPHKVIKTLKTLQHISAKLFYKDNVFDTAEHVRNLHGIGVFSRLDDYLHEDHDNYKHMVQSGIRYAGMEPQASMTIAWDGDSSGKDAFQIRAGNGIEGKAFAEEGLDRYLPKRLEDDDTPNKEAVYEALNNYSHYGNTYFSPYKNFDADIYDRPLPTLDESLKVYQETAPLFEPSPRALDKIDSDYAERCYDVFKSYGTIKEANDTPAKVWKDATQRMLDTGHSREEIKAVAQQIGLYDKTASNAIQGFLPNLQKHPNPQEKS